MSIRVNSGYSFGTNESLSADKLNAMYDDAIVSGMVTGDLESGYRLVDVAAAEPTPTDGYPWMDATGQVRYGDGTRFRYGSGIIFLTNKSGTTLVLGDVVRLDVATQDAVAIIAPGTDHPATVFGVVQETIANNAVGPIMYRGISKVKIEQVSDADAGVTFRNGYGIYVNPATAGRSAWAGSRSVSPTQKMSWFGYLLENPTGTFVPGTYYAKVFR